MTKIVRGSAEADRIDALFLDWRQGDLALEESVFVHVGDLASPHSDAADATTGARPMALRSEVHGLLVPESGEPDAEDAAHLDKWLALVSPMGRFTEVDGLIVSLESMTTADYVGSDKLDPDRLSVSRPSVSASATRRHVTLETNVDGAPASVTLEPRESDHDAFVEAYRDRNDVMVQDELRRVGQRRALENPRDVMAVPQGPEDSIADDLVDQAD